jgi:hypothetical protein
MQSLHKTTDFLSKCKTLIFVLFIKMRLVSRQDQ